jgi:hypothetical protein
MLGNGTSTAPIDTWQEVSGNTPMRPDAGSDLLASEPESSRIGRGLRDARAWRITAFVLLVLTLAAIGLAWHYRNQAKDHSGRAARRPIGAVTPRTLPPPLQVRMTTAQVALRAGRIHGAIRFTLTSDPTARLTHGQIAVSAVLHGVPSGSHVALTGGLCQGSSATRTWAKGKADAAGVAVLQGRCQDLHLRRLLPRTRPVATDTKRSWPRDDPARRQLHWNECERVPTGRTAVPVKAE